MTSHEKAAWEALHARNYFRVADKAAVLREYWYGRDAASRAYWLKHTVGTLTAEPGRIPYTPDSRVFEIGCGYGGFGARLAPYIQQYRGADIAENIVREGTEAIAAAHIPNMDLIVRSPENLGEGDGTWDIVFSTAVLIHTPPDVARHLLRATHDLLADDGWWSHQINIGRHDYHVAQTQYYTEETYRALLDGVGLDVVTVDDWPPHAPGRFARFVAGRKACAAT